MSRTTLPYDQKDREYSRTYATLAESNIYALTTDPTPLELNKSKKVSKYLAYSFVYDQLPPPTPHPPGELQIFVRHLLSLDRHRLYIVIIAKPYGWNTRILLVARGN